MNDHGPKRERHPAGLRGREWQMIAVAGLMALVACGPTAGPPAPSPSGDGWHEFQGSWTASGSRRIIPLGGDRRASVIALTGSMMLAGPARPGVGFRAEVVAMGDSETGLVGRAVWTDEKGDQAFSTLRGEGTAAKNRIEGTFIGGTGRYAGATGTYEFSWQYVIESDDGTVHGRAVGLKGRVRVAQPQAAPAAGSTRP